MILRIFTEHEPWRAVKIRKWSILNNEKKKKKKI